MASKDKALKKQMLKEGILAIVVFIALAGGGMLASNYAEDAQMEKQAKATEGDAMMAERNSIKQELGSGFDVNNFYSLYSKNHSTDFQPKRETATQLMAALHESNYMTNLSVTISPIADAALPDLQLKSGKPVKSDVGLSFGSITDSSVFGFIEALERKMPGVVVVRDLKLNHTANVSRDVLYALSQHRITPLVTSDLSFIWLGIRPTEEAKKPGDAGSGKEQN